VDEVRFVRLKGDCVALKIVPLVPAAASLPGVNPAGPYSTIKGPEHPLHSQLTIAVDIVIDETDRKDNPIQEGAEEIFTV
jgi:hypothetical protein